MFNKDPTGTNIVETMQIFVATVADDAKTPLHGERRFSIQIIGEPDSEQHIGIIALNAFDIGSM